MNAIEKMEEQIRELEAKVEKLYLILNITPENEQNEKRPFWDTDLPMAREGDLLAFVCNRKHRHNTVQEAADCSRGHVPKVNI